MTVLQDDKQAYMQEVQDLKAKGESWAEWKAMQNMLGKQRERARCVIFADSADVVFKFIHACQGECKELGPDGTCGNDGCRRSATVPLRFLASLTLYFRPGRWWSSYG
jgi:hypothetical protein